MDSNTFWMIFGTSKKITKSGPLHPIFIYHLNSSKNKKTYGLILETYYFSYLNILEIQNLHLLTLPDINNVELIF